MKPTPKQIVRLVIGNAADLHPAELQESPASKENSQRIIELIETLGVDSYLDQELWDLCKSFYETYCTGLDIVTDKEFGDVFEFIYELLETIYFPKLQYPI